MNAKSRVPIDDISNKKDVSKPAEIRAKDVLATNFVMSPVICVPPKKTVREIALLLTDKKISAVPVVDDGEVVGIVSEGDLIQRHELGVETGVTAERNSGADSDSGKSYGAHACDVMTRDVVTVSEDTSLAKIVETLLAKNIRRVLVMREAELVGVVSRSDIVRVLAARPEGVGKPMSGHDDIVRFKVIETLLGMPGTTPWLASVSVSNGVVELSGSVQEETALRPSRIAIENIPNIVEVKDKRTVPQPFAG